VENRVSGMQYKVEELNQTVKDHERTLRKYKWNTRCLGQHEKTKPMNHGIEEGEEIQTKGIDNLFNRIIAENFPNLEKQRVTQVKEAYRTPNCQNQKLNTPQTHHIQNTQHTEQRKNSESCKRKK
jgi:hypothetical protein